jgi:hypothetical protein
MTSINKKALEQERMLNKLIPKNKHMKRELEELSEMLEDCEERLFDCTNNIAMIEAELDKYKIIVSI